MEVSSKILASLVLIQADALRRLFLGFFERQTLHLQEMSGTPADVPDPRIVRVSDFAMA